MIAAELKYTKAHIKAWLGLNYNSKICFYFFFLLVWTGYLIYNIFNLIGKEKEMLDWCLMIFCIVNAIVILKILVPLVVLTLKVIKDDPPDISRRYEFGEDELHSNISADKYTYELRIRYSAVSSAVCKKGFVFITREKGENIIISRDDIVSGSFEGLNSLLAEKLGAKYRQL